MKAQTEKQILRAQSQSRNGSDANGPRTLPELINRNLRATSRRDHVMVQLQDQRTVWGDIRGEMVMIVFIPRLRMVGFVRKIAQPRKNNRRQIRVSLTNQEIEIQHRA